MKRSLAFIFPGQNSRYPAMLEKLVARDCDSLRWIERASDVLGRDLAKHFRAANPAIFARNRDVQIGVFLANHLHWQNLDRAGVRAGHSAGLSLGEYNHLVHIGAIDFDDAVRLLEARGTAYERGPAGMMAAICPVALDELEPMLHDLGLGERLGVAMINSPRQIVLSGDAGAVDAGTARAEDAFGTATVVIEPSVPMHSPLFQCVGDAFGTVLESVDWRQPVLPYVANVSGRLEAEATSAVFVDALSRQVSSTVRWRDCVEAVASASGETTFVETGPKSILSGFFGRRWFSPTRFATDAADDFDRRLDALIEGLLNE
jgi:[acyl-carrier-protein] S-malonyltransferase